MAAVNVNEKSLTADNASTSRTSSERSATLEERSQHAATKAELHRAMLWLYVALLTTISGLLGGLMLHLHNSTLNEIAGIRQLLIDIIPRLPGG